MSAQLADDVAARIAAAVGELAACSVLLESVRGRSPALRRELETAAGAVSEQAMEIADLAGELRELLLRAS